MQQALKTEQRQSAITRAAEAGRLKALDMPGESGIDLSQITWPDVKHYDFEHGKHTMELALHIAQDPLAIPLSAEDLKVLKAAALLHDVGRTKPWTATDEHHAARGASLADDIMKKTAWWAQSELRERVCKTIHDHSLAKEPPNDPLLRALWDAECYEACRFMKEGQEGMVLMVKRRKQTLSSWAANENHHARWRARYA
jgi:HD superfamily phosphodiesterase